MSATPKALSTMKRELARVSAEKDAAWKEGNTERLDWLHGAEVALSWVLGNDTKAPSKAFRGTQP